MRPRVTVYRTPVRWAAPQAIAQAVGLGWLYGKAIAGDNGAVRYGYPALGTRRKFTGYAFPPQIFLNYSARRVAAGAIRNKRGALPATNAPTSVLNSPLKKATATVTARQIAGTA